MGVPVIGTIAMFAGERDLRGWLPCDGRRISAPRHPALYVALGHSRANAPQYFALPKLADPVPGVHYIVCDEGLYVGEEDPEPPAFVPDTLGLVVLWTGPEPPNGCQFAEGQLFDVKSNQALFSVLGVRFGGDGEKKFALPNLQQPARRERAVICVDGVYPS
jgi:microcystin-dependent protein